MPPSNGLQAVGLNRISTGGPSAGGRQVGEEALDLCSAPLPRNRRARAPGSRRGQLGLEGGGWGGTAIPARGGAGTRRSPALRSQQRPSWEERACLFSSCTGRGGSGSRVSKRFHPLLSLPGPTLHTPGCIPEPGEGGVLPREKSA